MRTLAAALICLALAVAHTWPIASAPHRLSLNYNADAELNAWIVSWIAYALPHEPSHLFAGNIFQPDDQALAYSEPLLVPALIGAPIRWLGGSAVLTFNILTIIGLAGTAFAGWWMVYRWTGSYGAGLVSGALLAFNAHLLTRLPHLQAVHAWGLPLVFYMSGRIINPDPAQARLAASDKPVVVALSVSLAAVAMTSEYWLFMAGLMMLVQGIVGLRSLRALRSLAVAATLAAVFSAPALLPYLRLAGEGVRRPIELAAQFSATPSGYLVSKSRVGLLWGLHLFPSFFPRDIDVLFPGFAAIGLAAAGARATLGGGQPLRKRGMTLLLIAAVGFVLSLGPSTPVYRLAYHFFLPLQGLRVPARFGFLPLFSVAVLAGYGVAALTVRLHSSSRRMPAAALALAAVTLEAWHAPILTTRFTGVPRIYAELDAEKPPPLLVEVPFWPAETVYRNAEYVLNATEHRTPIMNGYSGYTPDAYRRRALAFWFFPEPWAIEAMRREGATHVMVHLEQFAAEAEGVKAALAKQHELQLVREDRSGHQLYTFVAKPQ